MYLLVVGLLRIQGGKADLFGCPLVMLLIVLQSLLGLIDGKHGTKQRATTHYHCGPDYVEKILERSVFVFVQYSGNAAIE